MAPLGAIVAKAKAFEVGLQFAKDMLIQDFILEGDSQVLVNALKDLSPPPSFVATLVYSSVADSHDFCQVDFSHVRRQGNRPVHLLAKHAVGIANFFEWGLKRIFISLNKLLTSIYLLLFILNKSFAVFP